MSKLDIKNCPYKWHWSSTEYSSTSSWIQNFTNGFRDYYFKTNSYWARAIRRVKKSTCNAP